MAHLRLYLKYTTKYRLSKYGKFGNFWFTILTLKIRETEQNSSQSYEKSFISRRINMLFTANKVRMWSRCAYLHTLADKYHAVQDLARARDDT